MKKEQILANIERLKLAMPAFVNEYYYAKSAIPYSSATLYEYLKEFERFFSWLLDSGIVNVSTIKEIPLTTLENLSKVDMETYVLYLRERPKLSGKSATIGLSQASVNRTISALSSLYKYLTEEAENEDGEPYFYRNVMKKVKTKRLPETLASRAQNIKGKLLLGKETQGFLDFIESDYEKKLSSKAASPFKKNKERDLAIIALMLASGIRLSEAVNINLQDLHLNVMIVEVIRKGGKRDAVNIANFARPYLENYLDIRNNRYKAEKNEIALFLTLYRNRSNRIDNGTIEKLVAKYSEAYKIRITPHKLRHTLATRLYAETNSQVLVSHQLGHASTQTTDLYTHIVDEEQKNALNNL